LLAFSVDPYYVSPPENYVTLIVKALLPEDGLPVPIVDYFIYY
jgi:hypothetical protein